MRRTIVIATLMAALSAPALSVAAQASKDLTGLVVNLRGVPLADAELTLGGETVTTGADGRFRFENAVAGDIALERVAYSPTSVAWDGKADWLTITMAPRVVRGIHVSGTTAASNSGFQDMLDIAATTSVNSLMVDIKGESGLVFHETSVATVAELGSGYSAPFDLASRVAAAHEQGLYVITRIVSFEDPIAARARPAWALKDAATGALHTVDGQYWLDPTDSAARNYPIELAVEACSLGVDEIQFDYVRFPAGDKNGLDFDGTVDAASRQATITSFLAEARSRLEPMGCATAADIFGFITNKTHEGGIGQQLEDIAATIDVISPMIYPSHYSEGWYGYTVPNDHPGPVVTNASNDALARMTEVQSILRPWLQDFWYTASQVEVQITSVDALDLGWLLWNVASVFTVDGIPQTGELSADETAPAPVPLQLPSSGFYDVADTDNYTTEIGWLGETEITLGCNPPWNDLFCGDDEVTRGQMAAFLSRAFDLPPADGDSFTDDDGSTFEANIEALAAAGITVGCDEGRFCPDEPVTRAQMASFLVRALDLTPIDDPIRFVDDDGNAHETAIAALADAGVTLGCRPDAFCPDDSIVRSHMAAFLYRSLAG